MTYEEMVEWKSNADAELPEYIGTRDGKQWWVWADGRKKEILPDDPDWSEAMSETIANSANTGRS